MEVVDAIESVKTSSNGMMSDVPDEAIVIIKATVINPEGVQKK